MSSSNLHPLRFSEDGIEGQSIETAPRKSAIDAIEEDPIASARFAAAQTSLQVASLLEQAFDSCSAAWEDVATDAGTEKERLFEVLDGDGNIGIEEFARIMKALGFRLNISAYSVETGEELSRPSLSAKDRTKRDESYRTPQGEE